MTNPAKYGASCFEDCFISFSLNNASFKLLIKPLFLRGIRQGEEGRLTSHEIRIPS